MIVCNRIHTRAPRKQIRNKVRRQHQKYFPTHRVNTHYGYTLIHPFWHPFFAPSASRRPQVGSRETRSKYVAQKLILRVRRRGRGVARITHDAAREPDVQRRDANEDEARGDHLAIWIYAYVYTDTGDRCIIYRTIDFRTAARARKSETETTPPRDRWPVARGGGGFRPSESASLRILLGLRGYCNFTSKLL